MKQLVQTQKGSSKKQLQQLLKQKEADGDEMEAYIKEGRQYLKTLEDKVQDLRNLESGLKAGKSVAEINSESENLMKAEKENGEKIEADKIKEQESRK